MNDEEKTKKIVKQAASTVAQAVVPKELGLKGGGKRSMLPGMILHVITVSILVYILLRLSSIEIRLDRINNFIARSGSGSESASTDENQSTPPSSGPSCPFSMSYFRKKITPPPSKSQSEMVDMMSKAIQEANTPQPSLDSLPPVEDVKDGMPSLEEVEEEEDIPQ